MPIELAELIAYGIVLLSQENKVYLCNRFIRFE